MFVTVSLRIVKPAFSRVWIATKGAVSETKAKSLVENRVIFKVEAVLDKLTSVLIIKLRDFRNTLLPKEEKYLIKQLELVRNKMKDQGKGGNDTTCS